jgi:serine/threonine-protein kinase
MINLIGHSVGRYHILEQLGEGGMATVYKAYDTRLENEVAIKVIRTDELPAKTLARARQRFEREAKALAKLNHLNIVKVIDYGEYEGLPYLVMPYLSGGTLKQKLAGKALPWQEAVRILLPIARSLDYAHRQNMIHRDVKPANILITSDGDPLLTDFGIAKIVDEETTMDLTGTSASVGTPEYMAPEQVISKTVDSRADIYALGVVLYEAVTGRRPFTADTPMAILFKHASEPLPRPKSFAQNLPDRVEQILLKALAKKPEDRYQTMAEFANALEACSGGSVARKNELPYRGSRIILPAVPRNAWISIGLALLGISLFTILSKPLTAFTRQVFGTSTPGSVPTSTHTTSTAATLTPAATTTPEFGIGSTMTGEDGMVMVYVPAGEFTMGSDSTPDEQPIHKVTLDSFWIDQTEVTNKQYAACVSDSGCNPPSDTGSSSRISYFGNPEFDEYPVIYVDWSQASIYCSWAGRKLPTEAQWEKAARGPEAFTYPWGNNTPNKTLLNFNSNIGDTTQVGTYENGKSPYGAFDMAGNVWEWVNDRYSRAYYLGSPSSNPSGSDTGDFRILRGGSWVYSEHDVRSTFRFWFGPTFTQFNFGFRCARGTSP